MTSTIKRTQQKRTAIAVLFLWAEYVQNIGGIYIGKTLYW